MQSERQEVRNAEAPGQPSAQETSACSYSREFLMSIHPGAYRSAQEVVPLVLELLRPRSLIDVGCGVGSWLVAFREHGVTDVLGVDGAYLDLDLLQIPREQFLAHDLERPLKLGRRFDLAVSLEVAEHLPAEHAATLVASLVGLAPVVLFSAAVPLQGGTHHVNEQWPGYWVSLFERHGYLVIDCLRDKVWSNDRVEWWYAQNMLFFCSPEALDNSSALKNELAPVRPEGLARVHPKCSCRPPG
jgi:SAM-dependent methyltransferase